MKTFEDVKIGRNLWSKKYGWGKVFNISRLDKSPINMQFLPSVNKFYNFGGHEDLSEEKPGSGLVFTEEQDLFWDEEKESEAGFNLVCRKCDNLSSHIVINIDFDIKNSNKVIGIEYKLYCDWCDNEQEEEIWHSK